jgi:serine/threonine protein kinase
MSNPPASSDDGLTLDSLERIDRLCLKFEQQWKANKAPRIEDFLAEVSQANRGELLGELVRLDLDYHQSAEQVDDVDALRQDYLSRFPAHETTVLAAFDQCPAKSNDRENAEETLTIDDVTRSWDPSLEAIGRYRIEGLIGSGAFGNVYRTIDSQLDRVVAVKVLRSHRLTDSDRERFEQEARLVASLKHAGIVTVHDVGKTDDGSPFIVMEYIEGQDIRAAADKHGLTHRQIAEIFVSLGEALHYAHTAGLIHRDIKPSNVLLDERLTPYVVDFGLAIHESVQRLRAGEHAGTPHFMSPEQIRGESHRLDGRTDIWALGVTLYELLTGRRPFQGTELSEIFDEILYHEPKPLRQIDDSIPSELERICLKCLAKRMSERYMAAVDLAVDLRQWLFAEDSTASDVTVATSDTVPYVIRPDETSAVIPKGLRSFDDHDATFFTQLLPGPVDSDGTPASLRFWKTRIEEPDGDRTFSVGVIYGPSGCGKSSFVKAGLLPRLDSDINVVYVEATADETENRLLRGIAKHARNRSEEANLPESNAALREQGPASGSKTLIVLDQFEQWLHAVQGNRRQQLTTALRQCDGKHLQCLLLVRDDFWMALTRFMRELEVPLVEGENSAAVDLFDLRHARNVLIKFGQAFGRLPDGSKPLSEEQGQFLDRAAASLAEDDAVIPIRLSLFAEMLKGRDWETATWTTIGGPEAVGAAFLEETFNSRKAPLEYRQHQQAAQRVLEALLPAEATDIKGQMKSQEELMAASGYRHRPADFQQLLRILDTELRLITPTDPEGLAAGLDDSQRAPIAKHFQLTHDYLVPALREWLTQQQRATWSGRAQLLLQERTRQWGQLQENRFLPSLIESVWITGLAPRERRSAAAARMMRRAWRMHAMRATLLAICVAAVVMAITYALPEAPTPTQDFFNPSTDASTRLAALEQLDPGAELWDRLLEVAGDEPDQAVRSQILMTLSGWLKNEAISDAQSDERRAALVAALTAYLQSSPSEDSNRRAVWSEVVDLASELQVTAYISEQLASNPDDELTDDLLRFVIQIPIDDVADQRATIRWVISTIHEHENAQLVAACVELLGASTADAVLEMLMAAYDDDVKVSAEMGLLPYARGCSIRRVDELTDEVESRLERFVRPGDDGVIRWTYELEYLTQAAGLVWRIGSKRRPGCFRSVGNLLQNHESLEDPDMLDTVLISFSRMYDGHIDGDPTKAELWNTIRSLLESGDLYARIAAAQAAGIVDQLPNATDITSELTKIAADEAELLNLREVAIRSLGNIARGAQSNSVLETFAKLIGDERTDSAVLKVALEEFASIAGPGDAASVFPKLTERPLAARALSVLQAILLRHPESSGDVVARLLEHLDDRYEQVATALPLAPERLLFEFSARELPATDEQVLQSIINTIPMLAERIATSDQQSQRELAERFLSHLVREIELPEIDPAAAHAGRLQQWENWKQIWETRSPDVQLSETGQLKID